MKQKIVIRVSMKRGPKYRSKALKIAASVKGSIETISLVGDDKDKVEVVGDIDPMELTELLRKGFGSAQLETVNAVEDKDKDKDKDKNKDGGITWTCSWGVPHHSSYCYCYNLGPYPSYSIR
uniref:Heavy metal-associated isoprenylated plant protein 3-like n=1 Tax=Cucumis melo TaxID=3656 RepID=A0A9I9D5Q6_CUCME